MESSEIAEILQKHSEGSTKLYDILVSHLSDPKLKGEVLLQCLKGLKGCTSLLNREFEHLVGVILRIDWLSFDISIIKDYQGFIVNLVSAHTDYLRACLRMIIKNFLPRNSTTRSQDFSDVDAKTRQKHDENFFHLHCLLKNIVKLVPMTPVVLIPQLTDNFPFMTKEAYIQACYVRNLLQVAQYMPKQRVKILELIIDKMIKLDVRSPREAIRESSTESDEDDMDVIFDMEGVESTSQDSPELKCSNTAEGQPMTHKEADKLDVMMDVLLDFIQKICRKDKGQLDWESTKQLYRELLLVFDRIILPTHASCHVQFIMFFILQFKQPLVEGYIDYLWKKVSDPNTQPIFRQASVAYIASLICRAKYVDINLVSRCLEIMVGWTHRYIRQTAETGTKADIAHHGSFYSVCQSIFYIFAFRLKELLSLPNGYKACQGFNLQSIVTCRLNPLKFSLPIVARIFATTARNHQLVYCDSIMEHNRRMTLPEAGTSETQQTRLTHQNPLDSFFPFDPYWLSRSGKLIHPIYQEYEGSTEEMGLEDEDGNSDGMSEHSQEEFEVGSFSKKGQMMATSPTDLLMYSISPGFKHV